LNFIIRCFALVTYYLVNILISFFGKNLSIIAELTIFLTNYYIMVSGFVFDKSSIRVIGNCYLLSFIDYKTTAEKVSYIIPLFKNLFNQNYKSTLQVFSKTLLATNSSRSKPPSHVTEGCFIATLSMSFITLCSYF